MELVLVIIGITILVIGYGHLNKANLLAKELDKQFNRPKTKAHLKDLPKKFRIDKRYAQWEQEAESLGFKKLGDLYYEQIVNGTENGTLFRVMANDSKDTILAFSKHTVGAKIIEQTEMENWREDGSFIYSTNNRLTYLLKSPEKILVNKIKTANLMEFVESHRKFLSDHSEIGLRNYHDIQTVAEGIRLQQELREEVTKTKEFPIDESEAIQMGDFGNEKTTHSIYEKLRALQQKRHVR